MATYGVDSSLASAARRRVGFDSNDCGIERIVPVCRQCGRWWCTHHARPTSDVGRALRARHVRRP